ncbi:hypothetical protein H1P_1000024 [Hyella patelloides LEGE 07179]|uniref:Uncharacterized protein n=1 Tax=Hyella patelloides LEGE 07179 TaxID=945734 RepID=A0A563VIY3_9CYAN|nr:hypothetical protein [Hyella patelloides]VEP11353.1 hypothetical protein H1P_1000024 [Hyella patelloides LEGE 07179]
MVNPKKNLYRRWNGKQDHHRYKQLVSILNKPDKKIHIYYHKTPPAELLLIEKKQILKYQPFLNNTPVKKSFNLFDINTNKQQFFDNFNIDYHNTNCMNKILTILSDFQDLQDNNRYSKELKQNTVSTANNLEVINSNTVQQQEVKSHNVKYFHRRFIPLKSSKINLNLELEICIDSKNRLFVRHHTFSYIRNRTLEIIDPNQLEQISQKYIYELEKKLLIMSYPVRWIGYKLICEQVLLIDDEEDLQIETLAIMLPLRMFINLLEDIWLKNYSSPKFLEQEEQFFIDSGNLSLKLAKYLYDEKTTLVKLVEQIN